MKKFVLLFVVLVTVLSCKKDYPAYEQPPSGSEPPPINYLLKDVVIPNLPAPYYHFEYDTSGKVIFASFASDFSRYDITYAGGHILELRNNIIVNKDRLDYFYDDAGRVNEIRYTDSTGLLYTRIRLAYTGDKLVKMQRERILPTETFVDRIMTMSYYEDGNLAVLTSHYLPHGVQEDAFFIDRFEQYDDKINTDAFSLLHSEFFDHLVLLPEVRLQKNNPRKETRRGSGINYDIAYTYLYDNHQLPLSKNGLLTIRNGADSGTQHQTSVLFSYY